jgi:hypothetical protein
MTLRAIPTPYGGVKFRSRLEARWAIFFDRLHIPWEYEPQGFDIGDGEAYLPDFLLGLGDIVWAEIKPSVWADPDGVRRWRKFMTAQPAGTRGMLLTSMNGHSDQVFESGETVDGTVLDLPDDWPWPHRWFGGHGSLPWSSCPSGYHFDLMPRGLLAPCSQCGETIECGACNGTGLHKGGPEICYCCVPEGSGREPVHRSTAPPWDDDKRISEAYSAALSARFGTG